MPSAGAKLRYLAVGAFMALVNLALLWALIDRAGLGVVSACTLSFFTLNAVGYALNKVQAFQLEARVRGLELLRYYLVMAVSLALNLALMALLVYAMGWHWLPASVLVSVALALLNYAAHARLTFDLRQAVQHRMGAANPRRVLQVSAFFPAHGGGIEVVAGQIALRAPQRLGLQMHWMAGGDASERPSSAVDGLLIERARSADPLERRIGLPAPLWSPGSLWRLWRAVGQADLVHVHDYLYMPTLMAMLFAALRGRPVLLTQHIGDIPFGSAAARRLLGALNRSLGALALAGVDQAVFVGKPVMDYFARFTRFRRAPVLLPNGVDHERHRPGPTRQDPAPDAALQLLFVGRMVEKKGVALLRGCLDLPGTSWRFIGSGPLSPSDWPELQGSAAPAVQVLGRMPAADIVAHYQTADLLVLPSTGEGFPLVLQEALACGTPVLVSSEVFEAFPEVDERCVFHVELRHGDAAAALRARLQALLAAPDALRAARVHALALSRQWSWERCVDGYGALYSELYRELRRARAPERARPSDA